MVSLELTEYKQKLLDAIVSYAGVREYDGYNQRDSGQEYPALANVLTLMGVTKRDYSRRTARGGEFSDSDMAILNPEFPYLPD